MKGGGAEASRQTKIKSSKQLYEKGQRERDVYVQKSKWRSHLKHTVAWGTLETRSKLRNETRIVLMVNHFYLKLLSFFLFYPTNVNWQLDQTKKTQRRPAGYQTWVFRLPVGLVKKNWQFGERHCERHKTRTQLLSWLRSSVVRASDRQSEDPGSIPGGLRCVFFFHLIQLSVHICRIEKKKERSLIRMVPTETNFRFEQFYLLRKSWALVWFGDPLQWCGPLLVLATNNQFWLICILSSFSILCCPRQVGSSKSLSPTALNNPTTSEALADDLKRLVSVYMRLLQRMKKKGDHRPRNSAQYERVVELFNYAQGKTDTETNFVVQPGAVKLVLWSHWNAPEQHAPSDVREPISLHQAVQRNLSRCPFCLVQ